MWKCAVCLFSEFLVRYGLWYQVYLLSTGGISIRSCGFTMKLWPPEQIFFQVWTGQEYTLNRTRVRHKEPHTPTLPRSNLRSSIQLMFLGDGRKLQSRRNTHTDMRQTCEPPCMQHPELTIESQTLKLWDGNDNCCTWTNPLQLLIHWTKYYRSHV